MPKYKVFIHGVPVGHEMCGVTTETEREYLKTFYGMKCDATEFMRTDIVDGVSYYSYIRMNNVLNIESRPGAYFGITVSLGRNICKDIATLYNILEGTYKGVCVGSIVEEHSTGAVFLVRKINSVKYKRSPIINAVQIIIENNIDKLIGGNLRPIDGNINTHGNGILKFHISEVNSPFFIEAMLPKTVLISPTFETRSNAYNTLLGEYNMLKTECIKSEDEVKKLKGNLKSLEGTIANLHEEHSKADKRYKNELDTLKRELEATRQKQSQSESDKSTYEKIIEQARNAIEEIEGPYKQLWQLLTNQFSEKIRPKGRFSFKRTIANLHEELSRADKQYKNELDTLKRELEATRQKQSHCESEKSTYEKIIEQARNAIEEIEGPYKQLQRILMNQSQSVEEEGLGRRYERRHSLGKHVLSLLVLVIVVFVLIFVIKRTLFSSKNTVATQTEVSNDDSNKYNDDEKDDHEEKESNKEIDWNLFQIDLQGYNGSYFNKDVNKYKLRVVTNDYKPVDDNFPVGTWECTQDIEGVKIVDNCSISISGQVKENTNFQIFYKVDGEHKVTRTIKIKYGK